METLLFLRTVKYDKIMEQNEKSQGINEIQLGRVIKGNKKTLEG